MKKWKLKQAWRTAWQVLCNFDIKPASPKRSRVIDLFNRYADKFEYHLTDRLNYTAPQQLVKYCKQNVLHNEVLDDVLDLGCGTGLLGVEFDKHFAVRRLVGVDFSEKMLDICKEKGIYHELHHAELCKFLYDQDQSFDVIASTDVLIYISDLGPVLNHAYSRLKPGGYLAFTVEKKRGFGFTLRRNGRFQHSLKYLTALYNKSQYSRMSAQAIDLRKECGNMVVGYLVLLQK